jgi:metal-sulfur cluster biosynthetic enzyme
MEYLEDKTTLIITKEFCPVTGATLSDIEDNLLIIELDLLFNVELNAEWEINPLMREHMNITDTMLLAEVYNYCPDLSPEDAIRSGRALSLEIKDFFEFFVDVDYPEKEYMFVSHEIFEAVRNKYLK